MDRAAVVAHGAFTLAMVGVMLAVQLVIYPQFRSVPIDALPAYAADHSRRIVMALAVVAPAEIVFAAWIWLDPAVGVNRTAAFVSGTLLAIGWVSTAVYFGPYHGRLQAGEAGVDQLIATNWFRTLLWLARGGFAVWFLWKVVDR